MHVHPLGAWLDLEGCFIGSFEQFDVNRVNI